MPLETLARLLRNKQTLSRHDIVQSVEALLDDKVSVESKEEFFVALTAKGETPEELAAFAQAMHSLALDPQIRPEEVGGTLVDTCGTGGDKLNLFNISTAAALVVASAGVPVAKHGNRAVTSYCGSADVLEALGVPIDLPPAEAKRSLQELNFAFLFAPSYHSAFQKLAPVRRRLAEHGQQTILNLLGPLLNPARPNVQVIGIYSEQLLDCYAQALKILGARHALVVHGQGMDELTTLGTNFFAELKPNGDIQRCTIDAALLGFKAAPLRELVGGSAKENAVILENILKGQDRGPRRDIVLLNAAAAFIAADKVQGFSAGIKLAAELIDGCATLALLAKLRKFDAGEGT